MRQQAPCCICGSNSIAIGRGNFNEFECSRCGPFRITDRALTVLGESGYVPRRRAILSGWIRDQVQGGGDAFIDPSHVNDWERLPRPDVRTRADRLLSHLATTAPSIDAAVSFITGPVLALTYCADESELHALADGLVEEGLLRRLRERGSIIVTPRGFMRHDELAAKRPSTVQAFVAMWFNPALKPIYDEGFAKGISAAGYEPLRVDSIDHTGKIDDEIIAQIRKSRLLVADYTGHRGSVYFEAGFGMGLGLPVFWTCRESDMADLQFDVRQYNFIAWKDAADLAARLQRRIEAVIGAGPKKPKS